jgi:hypothetical protein
VNGEGLFDRNPARAGLRYWRFRKQLARQVEDEVDAQFDRLEKTGLRPTHVDGHQHLHIHPLLFDIIARQAAQRGITWIRIPREPLSFIIKHHFPLMEPLPLIYWLMFGLLADRNLRTAHALCMRAVNNVYGLSATGKVTEGYLLDLLPSIKAATNEIYIHPDMGSDSGRMEMKALTSARTRERMDLLGLRLVGFEQLSAPPTGARAAGEKR